MVVFVGFYEGVSEWVPAMEESEQVLVGNYVGVRVLWATSGRLLARIFYFVYEVHEIKITPPTHKKSGPLGRFFYGAEERT